MTNEEEQGFPDFPMPDVDWSQMEQFANSGKTDDASSTPGLSHVVLSEEMVHQRVVWDIAPHELYEQVATYLGLSPSSEDVLDKEHEDAHARLSAVLIVAPPVDLLSKLAAKSVLGTMLVMNDQTEDIPLDSEEYSDSVDKLEVVIFNAVLASIAELVDWGLLHTPHVIGTFGASSGAELSKIGEIIKKAVEDAAREAEQGDNDE